MVLLVALEKKNYRGVLKKVKKKEANKQTKIKKQRNKEKKRGKERKKNSPFACNAFWVTGIIIESVHSST